MKFTFSFDTTSGFSSIPVSSQWLNTTYRDFYLVTSRNSQLHEPLLPFILDLEAWQQWFMKLARIMKSSMRMLTPMSDEHTNKVQSTLICERFVQWLNPHTSTIKIRLKS